jgi:hypothetical protein
VPPNAWESWTFLPIGYLLSVAIELPVLIVGLSRRHPLRDRFMAGLWLTACTYPIVVLVFPFLIWESYGRGAYLAVAETFAPMAECTLFWLAYGRREEWLRRGMFCDFATIVAANLASFLIGELLFNRIYPGL